ncbi:hypothetical protein ACQ4PT_023120 [Festuca glaucescens]
MEGGWSLHLPVLARIHDRVQDMFLHTAGLLDDSTGKEAQPIPRQGKVSADRVAQYLQEELKCDTITEVPRNDTDYDMEIDHGAFIWELETTSPTITDVNLKVKRGMKVAICGMEKYQKVIQACALTKDLELFANGDLTEIGERGINISGGQKQRIQIARSVYQDADIYLFDDPFSAVDAHTGGQLFKDCLMGMLKDKTILYVTHQVEFLPAADLILVMQGGKIVEKGTFDDLLKQNIGFEAIVGAHSQAIESVINAESSSRILSTDRNNLENSDNEFEKENDTGYQLQGIIKQESAHDASHRINEKGRLTQDEEREKGGIGKKVYWAYLVAVHGGALAPTLDKCQLGDIVRQSPKKLDSTVVENGENWSVGQRQLFCLGRVLLKRSNILVLDEATASVDSSTDAIIQQTLREEFGDCTVLTVAHRIHTVIDSDLIFVFSEGRIIEYNTPSRLLEDGKSEFSRLIKDYSRRSKGF